jgi:zinc-binding alcohol dehydrogenase family protein
MQGRRAAPYSEGMMMRAVAFEHSRPISAEDSLINIEMDVPQPRHHDLLVEVKAVSVNPTDVKIRRYDDPLGVPRILGFDAAGIVRGVGHEVTQFGVGDEVYYCGVPNRPGSNAEFQLVDERIAGRKPKSLGFAESAALPLTGLTAWEMLFERFKIPRDQTAGGNLLIIGGAGGVGSMAVQLAAELTDLSVIATASRPETEEWCKALGAHHVISHRQNMAGQMRALDLAAPDYVFCTTHAEVHWAEMTRLVAPDGAIGILERGAPLSLSALWEKSASIHTEYVFARGMQKSKSMTTQHRTLEALAYLIDNGTLRSTMTENFGLINAENLKRAHAAIEAGSVRGKIVLEGFGV